MLKQRNNSIAVLDIGSSKVVCIIAKCVQGKKIEILGVAHHSSKGINSGIISDIATAQKSIKNAVLKAEKSANIKVTKVYIAVSSNTLLSQRVIAETSVTGKEITHKDLKKLLLNAVQTSRDQQMDVIHTFACDYILDGHKGIENPMGMYGNHLACKFHILSAPTNSLLNIQSCIVQTGLEIEGYISAVYALGLACLTTDEMHTGVTLVDFGAGTTSFGIFENGQLIYADSIPIGSFDIINDIAKVLCVSLTEAERIKNLYGGVISTDIDASEVIAIQKIDKDECDQISRAQLISIIHARVEEIIQIIKNKIIHEVDIAIIHKLVITGGLARTLRLKELIARRFNANVRLSHPKAIPIKSNQNITIEFSTAIGLLLHIYANIKESKYDMKSNTIISGLSSWIKRHFFE